MRNIRGEEINPAEQLAQILQKISELSATRHAKIRINDYKELQRLGGIDKTLVSEIGSDIIKLTTLLSYGGGCGIPIKLQLVIGHGKHDGRYNFQAAFSDKAGADLYVEAVCGGPDDDCEESAYWYENPPEIREVTLDNPDISFT